MRKTFSKSVSKGKRVPRVSLDRFTRLVFGLNQSAFILEGTLRTHFHRYESMYLELIRKIRDDMYDVEKINRILRILQDVEKIKSDSLEPFEKGEFKLYKWHSNEPNLETNDLSSYKEINFAKEHLGTKANETKILDLTLDKQANTFRVKIPTESQRLTKRDILKTLASIYNPLGFISSVKHYFVIFMI